MACPGGISFTRTEKYSSLVAEELGEMRGARLFSDFKIHINDDTLPCHRLVLSVHSAMMKAMLTSNMAEAAKHSVKLDHIDIGVMKIILDYMYLGQVSFHTDQLKDIIIACDYLRINMLKDMCVDQISSILEPGNVILWLKISDKLDLTRTKSQCLELVVANFTTISREPEFIDLTIVSFQECLGKVQDTSQQQDEVLNAALRWVDRDSTERLDHLETLVNQVQLDLCSLQGVLGTMQTYERIIASKEGLLGRFSTTAIKISAKKPNIRVKPTLIIAGGVDDKVNQVCWKLTEDNFVEVSRIPCEDLQSHHSVCRTPVGFIISGGSNSTICIMFNAETKKWSELEKLTKCRHSHGSVYVRGVLYVLGGDVEGVDSASFHSLVIEGGSWQEETDLPNCLTFPKVEELDASIFVLDEDTGHLFRMDVDQNVWTEKASLPTETYHGVSMTSHNGKLYLAGQGVFAWYTPETDTWENGHVPSKVHRYGSLVHHSNKLLLLGGSWEAGTDEVEEYDFEAQTWSVCPWKMPAPLDSHHALVLNIVEEV